MQNLAEEVAFCKYYVHSILCWFVGYLTFFSFHDSHLPILTMVGMPEIDILDVGMCVKMPAFVCWNLIDFCAFVLENNMYII